MSMKFSTLLMGAVVLFGSTAIPAQESAPPKNDYADPASWLCRPGRAKDACGRSDQTATILQADGSMRVELWMLAANKVTLASTGPRA